MLTRGRRALGKEEMESELCQLFSRDPEARLSANLLRMIADPIRPHDANGRFRPHPLVLILGLVGAFAIVTFTYFTYGPR